jgi:hypothetical protein
MLSKQAFAVGPVLMVSAVILPWAQKVREWKTARLVAISSGKTCSLFETLFRMQMAQKWLGAFSGVKVGKARKAWPGQAAAAKKASSPLHVKSSSEMSGFLWRKTMSGTTLTLFSRILSGNPTFFIVFQECSKYFENLV